MDLDTDTARCPAPAGEYAGLLPAAAAAAGLPVPAAALSRPRGDTPWPNALALSLQAETAAGVSAADVAAQRTGFCLPG